MKTPYASARSYREQEVLTAPPERLVVLLFEGAVRFLERARLALESRDTAAFHHNLNRADAILDELLATLDLSQGEIASRLQGIYVFCKRQLADARLARDSGAVARVARWLRELGEAFDAASRTVRSETGAHAPGGAVRA
ncbi:flagellar export chaperone FliS [Thermoleophilum album]|uniref:flagellar export chaperone FliS n=1 Tax=Thermoleophilum album TaxID=29539 RepID=UPI00237CE366|nr:flagellar export chaperone FliS [Thermoleophilum album]WDT94555.1 flagellar export chaperone FliS [Thermoleophilum album]